MRVFISYTRRDPDKRSEIFGRNLSRFLAARRIDVLFDELSFRHGKFLAKEIIDGIYSSDKFIFVVSENALNSKYVLTELNFARDRAIELLPNPFIHVVCITDQPSLSFLPQDLKAYLCHSSYGRSEKKLFYEIFFAIHEMRFGDLLKKMLNHNPDSEWLMIERYQKVDIFSKDGDVKVTTTRTAMNITNAFQKRTSKMKMWAYGSTEMRDLNIIATDEQGKPLPADIIKELYRGEKTTTCTIKFRDEVPPDEVFTYRTEYTWPKGFDLNSGDSYTLDSEDMVYGYLRVDFFFPRFTKPINPSVTIRKKQGPLSPQLLSPMGSNKFNFFMLDIEPGTILEFHLSLEPDQ